MYDYIKGQFTYKVSNSKGCFATIETSNGVGYLLEIMDRDFEILPELCETMKLYTVLIHREDKMSLCGFLKREDRDIFNILTSVSGVGTKMAITLLNSFDVSDENYKELTRAKGVGPKLAQKIILELKDKLTSYQGGNTPIRQGSCTSCANTQNTEDAQMVLLSLGYTKEEVAGAIGQVLTKLPPNASAEEILKDSLKILSI